MTSTSRSKPFGVWPAADVFEREAYVRLVIVGTGTSVGKTHVACALLHASKARGDFAVGLKPIESGVTPSDGASNPSDQARLWAASAPFHVKPGSSFHVQRSLYALEAALSPHLAAELAGRQIDLNEVCRWVDEHAAPTTIIETAGGLFSPLSETATNLELLRAVAPDAALLVAPDRLGALHDVTATLGLAEARGVHIPAMVFCAPERPDESTGRNAHELARLGIAEPLSVFPRAAAHGSPSIAAAERVLRALEAGVLRNPLAIKP